LAQGKLASFFQLRAGLPRPGCSTLAEVEWGREALVDMVEWEVWPEPVVDMVVDMLEVGALQAIVVLVVLDTGKTALLAVSGVVEAARALCRMWAAGRASTRRRQHTSMSDMEAILVVPGEISPASSRVVAF